MFLFDSPYRISDPNALSGKKPRRRASRTIRYLATSPVSSEVKTKCPKKAGQLEAEIKLHGFEGTGTDSRTAVESGHTGRGTTTDYETIRTFRILRVKKKIFLSFFFGASVQKRDTATQVI